jgi:hypothetical protein
MLRKLQLDFTPNNQIMQSVEYGITVILTYFDLSLPRSPLCLLPCCWCLGPVARRVVYRAYSRFTQQNWLCSTVQYRSSTLDRRTYARLLRRVSGRCACLSFLFCDGVYVAIYYSATYHYQSNTVNRATYVRNHPSIIVFLAPGN